MKELLKNSNKNLLRAKKVSDHNLAVAVALWDNSISQLIDDTSDLKMNQKALKEHEENKTLEKEVPHFNSTFIYTYHSKFQIPKNFFFRMRALLERLLKMLKVTWAWRCIFTLQH